jgi:hypothetical protein
MTTLRGQAKTWGAAPVRTWGGVLTEGDIGKVVERLNRPVPAQQVGEPGGLACWKGRLVMA